MMTSWWLLPKDFPKKKAFSCNADEKLQFWALGDFTNWLGEGIGDKNHLSGLNHDDFNGNIEPTPGLKGVLCIMITMMIDFD